MSFIVIATWTARESEESRVARALQQLVHPTTEEPGCLAYRVQRSLEDPRVFLLYEEYVDKDAYDAHTTSDHFRRFGEEEGIPLLESRHRHFYESL